MAKRDDEPKAKRGRKPNTPVTPDVDYLNALFEQSGKMQREVAAKLGISEQTFTKSKQGKRPFTLEEATKLAEEFGISLDVLVPHLGHKLTPRGVPITGKVTADSRVSPVVGARKGERVPVTHAPLNGAAYIYEPDDTVFVVDRGTKNGPAFPPEAISRLCVVEADNHDLPLLGNLVRGSQRGTVQLVPYYGNARIPLTTIHSAAIVIAILGP
jgi:transcriptional regulator with XRE-family HTH domain